MTAYLRLARISHQIKNLLIFAPLAFSLQINTINIIRSFTVFLCFSFMASATYVINDLFDLKLDRQHLKKRKRPIAAGDISVKNAILFSIFLLAIGLFIAFKMSLSIFILMVGYFVMNLYYSMWFKKIPIIDVMIIAIGFVMRILAGGLAIAVMASPWIVLCTFFGSLFIAFGKRKSEMDTQKDGSCETRDVLFSYNQNFLNQMIGTTAAITIMCYALFTIDENTVKHYGTRALIYTIPFVVFGIFRYFQIIYIKSTGDDPTKVFLSDRPILINLIFWAIIFATIAYIR
jgi:4-hydroxybenzoate polyprenyltransferase